MSGAPGPWRALRTWFSQGDGSARSLFFNRLWIFAALTVGLTGVAMNDRGIALLGVLVSLAAAVAWGWNRATLARVRYTRSIDRDRLFPGDRAELRIEIVNDKPFPVPWIAIDEEISEGIHLIDRRSTPAGLTGRRLFQMRTRLGPYERVVWRIAIESPERGIHTIGPAVIRTGDPLGFFANRLDVKDELPLLVYPRLTSLPPLQLPPRHAVGDVRVPNQLVADPLRVVGIRDYRPEDSFKSIHWKASARQGSLQVRVLEPTTTLQLAIYANIDTFEHYWEGLDIAAAERVIELTASLAMWAIAHRYIVSVASNGIVAGTDQTLKTPSGRGAEQRLRVLEGLARLSPFSSAPFLRTMQAASGRLQPGSTVVVITSLLPDGLMAHLHALIHAGQRVVLIPVGSFPTPALQGLIVRRLATPVETVVTPLERAGHG
jgi:uncharacterized protein (DUF58 family)